MDIRPKLKVGDIVFTRGNEQGGKQVLVLSISGLGDRPIVVQTLESGHYVWTLFPDGKLNAQGWTSLDVVV
jgi:hypothetical protein